MGRTIVRGARPASGSARTGSGRWPGRRGGDASVDRGGDRGATLVEFALIVVPLAALLFGAIEFGWAYNQQQDVRYGAREGARIAAVSNIEGNTAPTVQDIVDAVCTRMDSSSSSMHVSVVAAGPSDGSLWADSTATIQVSKPLQELTGFYRAILGDKTLTSRVTFKLEQKPTWDNTSVIAVSGGTITGGLQCP